MKNLSPSKTGPGRPRNKEVNPKTRINLTIPLNMLKKIDSVCDERQCSRGELFVEIFMEVYAPSCVNIGETGEDV